MKILMEMLKTGRPLLGALALYECPELIESLNGQGWDWVWLDGQHSLREHTWTEHIRACQIIDAVPVLLETLKDRDEDFAEEAAKALGQLRASSAVMPLADFVFSPPRKSHIVDPRLSAIEALGAEGIKVYMADGKTVRETLEKMKILLEAQTPGERGGPLPPTGPGIS